MGGRVYVCDECGKHKFAYHSCNHRSCPQCGREDTADWVTRELSKRVGAPYFMVTFTLPQELRGLFACPAAKEAYGLFFTAAAWALSTALANPRWLGAQTSGFTMVLHTWNQRLHFHPHLHCIVPGAGLHSDARVISVKSPAFLVPQPVLRVLFRKRFREQVEVLARKHRLAEIDPGVWEKDWGVHLQPFGNGQNAIQYLGAYVCRTAIGDARILGLSDTHVRFRWSDRANGGINRTETITGHEFVERYLRHVLPRGMRAIRYYGFCHPSAKAKRQRIAFHTGLPLYNDAEQSEGSTVAANPPPYTCPCCGALLRLLPVPLQRLWKTGLSPPACTIHCA